MEVHTRRTTRRLVSCVVVLFLCVEAPLCGVSGAVLHSPVTTTTTTTANTPNTRSPSLLALELLSSAVSSALATSRSDFAYVEMLTAADEQGHPFGPVPSRLCGLAPDNRGTTNSTCAGVSSSGDLSVSLNEIQARCSADIRCAGYAKTSAGTFVPVTAVGSIYKDAEWSTFKKIPMQTGNPAGAWKDKRGLWNRLPMIFTPFGDPGTTSNSCYGIYTLTQALFMIALSTAVYLLTTPTLDTTTQRKMMMCALAVTLLHVTVILGCGKGHSSTDQLHVVFFALWAVVLLLTISPGLLTTIFSMFKKVTSQSKKANKPTNNDNDDDDSDSDNDNGENKSTSGNKRDEHNKRKDTVVSLLSLGEAEATTSEPSTPTSTTAGGRSAEAGGEDKPSSATTSESGGVEANANDAKASTSQKGPKDAMKAVGTILDRDNRNVTFVKPFDEIQTQRKRWRTQAREQNMFHLNNNNEPPHKPDADTNGDNKDSDNNSNDGDNVDESQHDGDDNSKANDNASQEVVALADQSAASMKSEQVFKVLTLALIGLGLFFSLDPTQNIAVRS